MKAIWEGEIIAESDSTEVVEGNHYFPADSVNEQFLKNSDTQTNCPWKGDASYYSIVVGAKTNEDAAWYYPQPKEAAQNISGHVAFWKGVEVAD